MPSECISNILPSNWDLSPVQNLENPRVLHSALVGERWNQARTLLEKGCAIDENCIIYARMCSERNRDIYHLCLKRASKIPNEDKRAIVEKTDREALKVLLNRNDAKLTIELFQRVVLENNCLLAKELASLIDKQMEDLFYCIQSDEMGLLLLELGFIPTVDEMCSLSSPTLSRTFLTAFEIHYPKNGDSNAPQTQSIDP